MPSMRTGSMKGSQLRHLVMCATTAAAMTFMTGCEKPVIAAADAPAVAGGVEFTLGSYELRYLELTDGDETFEYPSPVLIIPVTITNNGENELTYTPTHSAQQMNEGSTPLLYRAPTGEEAKLPPEQKTPINGVIISRGSVPKQITKPQTLAKGDSITDVYLFERPPADWNDLVFSLPPTWHRGKTPVLFTLPYKAATPKGPKVFNENEAVSFDGVEFTVTKTENLYVKTNDTAQGEGFSKNPLYKITYTVENKGSEEITYEPSHRAVAGAPGARLFSSAEGAHKRVQFGPTTTPEGQLEGKQPVAPGKKITDFVLFEMPSDEVTSLTFEYPASLFEKKGIARVLLSYSFKKPELPKELQKKDEKKEGEEEKKDK